MLAHDSLVEKLSFAGLKCCHLNINGLCSKLDEIKLLLFETKMDILAISESHLSNNTHDYKISMHSSARTDQAEETAGVVL